MASAAGLSLEGMGPLIQGATGVPPEALAVWSGTNSHMTPAADTEYNNAITSFIS